jgi:A/G-specific adenine glycosylase
MMELGALVCTARSPRCEACPVAHLCAWRAAGYPAGVVARRPVQKKYEGSDRQARGIVLGVLRASPDPVAHEALRAALPDAARLGRALDGLLTDGLVVPRAAGLYALP